MECERDALCLYRFGRKCQRRSVFPIDTYAIEDYIAPVGDTEIHRSFRVDYGERLMSFADVMAARPLLVLDGAKGTHLALAGLVLK